jgi:hypothetical protein
LFINLFSKSTRWFKVTLWWIKHCFSVNLGVVAAFFQSWLLSPKKKWQWGELVGSFLKLHSSFHHFYCEEHDQYNQIWFEDDIDQIQTHHNFCTMLHITAKSKSGEPTYHLKHGAYGECAKRLLIALPLQHFCLFPFMMRLKATAFLLLCVS